MKTASRFVPLLLVAVCGCSDDGGTRVIEPAPDAALDGSAQTDDVASDSGSTDAESDAVPDTETDTAEGFECEPGVVEFGNGVARGDCVTPRSGASLTSVEIRPDCTDANITALAEKNHLVVIPDGVTQDVLWVHFGGSGGQPTNTENIGEAAALEGYRYISLAYTNEPSIADRCQCPDGPRPPSCEGEVRTEILYGADVTESFVMEPDEAIVPRLTALLAYLEQEQPGRGWSNYLTADGEPVWERIAVSGFSQGGGMAGLIARDHAVARALYFSKGAGGTTGDPEAADACDTDADCEGGRCCAPGDLECDQVPASGGQCLTIVPSPWAQTGADTNGDFVGDNGPETRATPANRQFAIVHRDEGAWAYSPEVFSSWGMGSRDDYFDADTRDAIPVGTRLFSTGLAPRNSCSEHQSMGADSCQPRDPQTGAPAMQPVWRFAMSTPVDP